MNNRSLALGILVAMLAILAGTSNAQHSLQVDDGAGNIGIITGPTSGGISMFTLPSTPGTLITTGTGSTNPWLLQGNSLSALGASPTQWFGTSSNDDVIMKANNVEKLRLVSGGGVVIPGTALSIGGVAYTFPAAAPNGVLTNAGGVLSWAAAGGDLTPAVILAPTTSARNVVQPTLATVVPLTVKGFASQSDNLQEWQNSAGTVLASITSSGFGLFQNGLGFSGPGGLSGVGGANIGGSVFLYGSTTGGYQLTVQNTTASGTSGGIYVNLPTAKVAGTINGIAFNVVGGAGSQNDMLGTSSTWKMTSAGALTLSPLTASSLVATDASKTLVSVANGTGVLTNNGTGTLTWVAAGGGALVNFTESVNTTAPNATVPVVRLLATNAATDVDVALTPKGTGALTAQVADNAVAGGNKRGAYAVDWQLVRAANTQVASGAYATVGGGYGNTASGSASTVGGGNGNIASGTHSTVGGGVANTVSSGGSTIAGGQFNTASGLFSTVGGGLANTVAGELSAIAGGRGLTLDASADYSFGFNANAIGNDMTISAANTAVFGNASLWLANNNSIPSSLLFYEAESGTGAFPSGTKYVAFKSPSVLTATQTYELPLDYPSVSGYVLSSTTGGVMSWVAAGGGSGVNYNVTSTQNTATIAATNYLYDISYVSTVAAENALGARISSTNTSTTTNRNATGLTLNATATTSGTATGLAVTVSGGTTQNAATLMGGNVGIGTTSPYTQLVIPGKVATATLGSVSTGAGTGPYSIYVSGRYAYTANSSANTLGIFDVSNPAAPVSVGSVSTGAGSNPISVYVSGRYAYTANYFGNTLGIFDVSNPAAPVSVGSVSTGAGSNPISVYVSGRYAYTANYFGNTLGIFDVSNPAAPLSVGSVSTGVGSSPISVYVSGRYAYTANYVGNTLGIFDVSNPAAPLSVGSVSTGAGTAPLSVYVSGRYAYTANYGTNTLGIFDVSNPAAPVSVGSVSTGAGSGPASVYVSGRYAYTANNSANTLTSIDLGGAYTQSLEAGSTETGQLQVRNDVQVGGDLMARGGVTATTGKFSGTLSTSGGMNVTAGITKLSYATVAAGATIIIPTTSTVIEITNDAAAAANLITMPAVTAADNGRILIIHNGDAGATTGTVIGVGAGTSFVVVAGAWVRTGP